jgi:hypothetical protein
MRIIFCIFCVLFFFSTPLPAAYAASFYGKVLAPDGKPVADATVWVGEYGRAVYSLSEGTLRRTTTDRSGNFAATFPGEMTLAYVRVCAAKFAWRDEMMDRSLRVIKLQPVRGITGIVVDEQGKPVRNVMVRGIGFLNGLQADGNEFTGLDWLGILGSFAWSAAVPVPAARTDSQGRWKLSEANPGSLRAALQDSRFVAVVGQSTGKKPSLRLIARPSVTCRGRIVTPDGKPLPGLVVSVLSKDTLFTSVRTNAQGQFTFSNLSRKSERLFALDPRNQWVVSPLVLSGDAPWLLPDIKATRGIEVRGQVVNRDGGNPVVGALVIAGPVLLPPTGYDGRFRVRLAQDEWSFLREHSLVLRHRNFVPRFVPLPLTSAVAEEAGNSSKTSASQIDLGRLAMVRAVSVRGRVVDEKGQPVEQFDLRFSLSGSGKAGYEGISENDVLARTDSEGLFASRLGVGTVEVSSLDERWELRPAVTKWRVATGANTKATPFVLKARKVPFYSVPGRVVDHKGKPVAGVTVEALGGETDGKGGVKMNHIRDCTTDRNGHFAYKYSQVMEDVKIERIKAPGYIVRHIGQSWQTAGTNRERSARWVFEDSVVAPLNRRLSGRVFDMHGKPQAGALVVSPESVPFKPVKTDAQGRFTLTNLPADATRLYAAFQHDFVAIHLPAFKAGHDAAGHGASVELHLKTSVSLDEARRQKFFEQVARGPWGGYVYQSRINERDFLALALQKDGALSPGDLNLNHADWSKAGLAFLQAVRDLVGPQAPGLLKNGAEWFSRISSGVKEGANAAHAQAQFDEIRFDAEALYYTALAVCLPMRRPEAQRWLEQAVTRVRAGVARLNATPNAALSDKLTAAQQGLRLGVLASVLSDSRAPSFVREALTTIGPLNESQLLNIASEWGERLAYGSPVLLEVVSEKWPLEARSVAYASAARQAVRFDIDNARALLTKLGDLAKEPAALEKNSWQSRVEWATQEVALAFATKDPDSAWQEFQASRATRRDAEGLSHEQGFPAKYKDIGLLYSIAKSAHRQNHNSLASKALQAIAASDSNSPLAVASSAALADKFNRPLANALWKKTVTALKEERPWPDHFPIHKVVEMARWHGRREPALSRLQLETALHLLPSLDRSEQISIDQRPAQIAGAMAILDPVRALQIAAQIPERERFLANWQIMAVLLAHD